MITAFGRGNILLLFLAVAIKTEQNSR